MELIHKNIVTNLKAYFDRYAFRRGVVGLSGGIDSAVTFILAVEALGKENMTALILPEKGLTTSKNIDHARELAQEYGVRYEVINIHSFVDEFKKLPWGQNQMAKMNLKARIRMLMLYNFANSKNALVLGTSNKTETIIGYGTKYGDFAADIEVIGNLWKKDVYALAKYLDIPKHFIEKSPSAELHKGQTDEDELGITYEKLDQILLQIEEGREDKLNPLVQMIQKRVEVNKHKTHLPPVVSIEI